MAIRKVTSSKEVITSSDIQVKYEQLYQFLMDFLWEFKVVQDLANLELAIFKRFPDKDEMLKCLRDLKLGISYTFNELNEDDQPDFKNAFDELEQAINDYEETGCELYSVEEVIDEDAVEAAEDIDDIDEFEDPADSEDNGGKRAFKFGKIKKSRKGTLTNPFEE